MGPSFDKIPEIVLPPVLMTWKICLLRPFPDHSRTFQAIPDNSRPFYSKPEQSEIYF